MSSPLDQLGLIANTYAEENDTDVAVYFGDIVRPHDEFLIEACRQRRRRTNILLMLATRGGDASVAYRLGRAFQKLYKVEERTHEGRGPEFTIYIPTLCKSAGTIMATAATKIVMSDFAELGPIDVQLRNPLEVGERTSGLTPIQALESLKRHSKSLFVEHFKQLRFDESLTFSTKMAADVASGLTVGLLSPMYEQVDPIRLAEVERSLKISGDYTERLTDLQVASNLKEGAVARLLGKYPSHGFVIDTREAKELFKRVEEPDNLLAEVITEDIRLFTNWLVDSDRGPLTVFLSDEPEEKDDAEHSGESAQTDGGGKPEVREEDDSKDRAQGATTDSTTREAAE